MNTKFVCAAILIMLPFSVTLASEVDSAPPQAQAPLDDATIVRQGSYTAGAETRYQDYMADKYSAEVSWWSKGSLIASVCSLLLGAILAGSKKTSAAIFLCLIGVFGAIASLKSDDSKAAARHIDHAVLAKPVGKA